MIIKCPICQKRHLKYFILKHEVVKIQCSSEDIDIDIQDLSEAEIEGSCNIDGKVFELLKESYFNDEDRHRIIASELLDHKVRLNSTIKEIHERYKIKELEILTKIKSLIPQELP